MSEEELGLSETLKQLKIQQENIEKILKEKQEEEKPKEKKFKLPWSARVGNSAAKKGYSTYLTIKNNGEVDFQKLPAKDGVVIIDGFPRIATIDHKLSYKGKPLYIIPEWSMKPFSAVENYEKTEIERMNIAGRRTILATLTNEKIKPKGNVGGLVYIIIGAVVIGGIYYLAKSQGWI
jgi:hypothetical protein